MKKLLILLVLFSTAFSFSIESYYTNATIIENGDLDVHEVITFELEQKYNEGFRSIRPQDVESLDNLVVHSVKLNGEDVEFYKQQYGENYEIVWTETLEGTNRVELNYTLKNRVEIWDDYAKLCFEHYGANWDPIAKKFEARMTMPEASRGKTLHFEIYSKKIGDAYIDDLTVVIEMEDIPSGNYVGGCYLFAKDSVQTSKTRSGSAYEILQSERESYGSKTILQSEHNPFCFATILVIFLVTAVVTLFQYEKYPVHPETILPPEKEEPIVVSILLKNTYSEKDILAATLIDLINRGVIDIVELEKKGPKGAQIKRERTVLMLKRKTKLKSYEQAVVDMLFTKSKEVDLDALVEQCNKIESKSKARAHPTVKNLKVFRKELKKMLEKKKLLGIVDVAKLKIGGLMFGLFCIIMTALILLPDWIYMTSDYLEQGETLLVALSGIELVVIPISVFLIAKYYMRLYVPKKDVNKYARWVAFKRALGSSRIKEYPPSAAVIWGEILVYATALGMADKVKNHLSELDDLTLMKIENLEKVRNISYVYYGSAVRLRSVSIPKSRGGFSRGSSGGWSSSGGGFSSGRSGGGGFR